MIRTHHFAARDRGICIRLARGEETILAGVHEMGLVAEVYRIARETVDSRGGGPLESVTVGELAAVEPDLLEFAWTSLVSGTADEKSRLVVEWRRARQSCATCGEIAERAAGSWLRLCPRCSGALAVRGGDELDVRSVVFSEEFATAGGDR